MDLQMRLAALVQRANHSLTGYASQNNILRKTIYFATKHSYTHSVFKHNYQAKSSFMHAYRIDRADENLKTPIWCKTIFLGIKVQEYKAHAINNTIYVSHNLLDALSFLCISKLLNHRFFQ